MYGWMLWCALLAPQADPESGAPAPEAIRQAADQLKSSRFAEREAGYRLLWRAGEAAHPLLEPLLKSRNSEVRERARRILELHRLGLFPDTPPQVAALIDRFRTGDEKIRRAVLTQLIDQGEVLFLTRLLTAIPQDTRKTYLDALDEKLADAAGQLVLQSRDEDVRRLLATMAVTQTGARHQVAWWLLRGELPQELQRLEKISTPTESQRWLRVYGLRAAGRLSEAVALCEPESPEVAAALRLELMDWDGFAAAGVAPSDNRSSLQEYERLSYLATVQRLRGDDAAAGQTLDNLVALGENQANYKRYVVEALLLNRRIDQAVKVMQESGQKLEAMRLLASQYRHDEALRLAGVEPTEESCRKLFQEAAKAASDQEDKQRFVKFSEACEVAKYCHIVGLKELALEGFRELAGGAERGNNRTLHKSLCEQERMAGLHSLAFEQAVASNAARSLLTELFATRATDAGRWLPLIDADGEAAQLARVRELLEGEGGPPDWDALEKKLDPAQAAAQWILWAEAAERYGDSQRAERCYRAAAEAGSKEARLKVGDILAGREQWREAATQYRLAGPTPLAIYLQGWAMQKIGDAPAAAEGAALCRRALLMPLAGTRKDLGMGLRERELNAEAVDCFRTARLINEPQGWDYFHATQQLGNLVVDDDPLQAAALWELHAVSTMKTATHFINQSSYLRMPFLIHKTRARGFLMRGQKEGVAQQIELSRSRMPGNIDLAEELVPELDKLEFKEEAEELFGKMFRHLEQGLEVFPDSALYHNNLAWLAARCNRRLDDALRHSQRAVELTPDSPTYIDTLAEVEYRRGNRDEAIQLMKRCLELDGRSDHYPKQLKRFEAGEP